MKKSTVILLTLATISIAGTIENPTYIKSGKYNYSIDDSQNHFKFILHKNGKIFATATKNENTIKTIFAKPSIKIYNANMINVCENIHNKPLNCNLKYGSYHLTIESKNTDGYFEVLLSGNEEEEPKIILLD